MKVIEDMYEVGAVIQERYLVEDILGKGGFSVVYLVRDQLSVEEQSRFALKMLSDRDKQEGTRFLLEGELLTRLHHHALPRIQRAFEDETARRACILMDYVEGINLDKLRKRQPDKRFSLAEALVVLRPVVEALNYLHTQPMPIIHRDIKPSNLILRKDGRGAALVDFGIAKEYEPDATTTAVRHCSPGYGAPEQYSSAGTDQRTDDSGGCIAARDKTGKQGSRPAHPA
jgi:serine/threonine protein kinase